MTQRRRFVRRRFTLPAVITAAEVEVQVTILELSGQGCVLQCPGQLPDSVELSFTLKGSSLRISSRIVWQRQSGDRFFCGLDFDIDSAQRSLIVDEILGEIIRP
ncbi:MAG: PilZ domain-containing protein [Candidatus Wallbacteria bacterium]|nr:PilZ domain-containing protein [Candidatus Wallbacteria bacterium]